MTTYNKTASNELMWGLYFLLLSYFLVSFYSSFSLFDSTITPFNISGGQTTYPKLFVIIYVWSVFLIGKGLLFLAASFSKKSLRKSVYWISSAFFIIPIIMCLNLIYLKRQGEKSQRTNNIEIQNSIK
jgi:hypothetical protein